jgi:hypothetical protein
MAKYSNTKTNRMFKIIQLTTMGKRKFSQKMNYPKKNSRTSYLNSGFHMKIQK